MAVCSDATQVSLHRKRLGSSSSVSSGPGASLSGTTCVAATSKTCSQWWLRHARRGRAAMLCRAAGPGREKAVWQMGWPMLSPRQPPVHCDGGKAERGGEGGAGHGVSDFLNSKDCRTTS